MTYKQFRRLCLAMPEAEERETWGEATFRVKDRIFAMGSPEGEFVSVKATPDDQTALVEMDPQTFAPSAYTGRFGWVRVRLAGINTNLAQQLVTSAWKRTAQKRLVADHERKANILLRMARREKMIEIPARQLKSAKRQLERLEVLRCENCAGAEHVDSCPAKETRQLINYLGRAINTGSVR